MFASTLKRFHAHDNYIEEVTGHGLQGCESLEDASLQDNNIRHIVDMTTMFNLTAESLVLNIENNPLECDRDLEWLLHLPGNNATIDYAFIAITNDFED